MYKSLDLLPIVIYYRIINSGDLHLLNPKNEEISQEELFILWDSLHNEFQDLDDNHLSKKILMLMKNYDYYILKYEIVNRSVEALRFSYMVKIELELPIIIVPVGLTDSISKLSAPICS